MKKENKLKFIVSFSYKYLDSKSEHKFFGAV